MVEIVEVVILLVVLLKGLNLLQTMERVVGRGMKVGNLQIKLKQHQWDE